MKETDIRPMVKESNGDGETLTIVFDWRERYMSPLALIMAVMEGISQLDFSLTKVAQRFEN